MKYVSDLKSSMDVHKEQAFKLNYAIANDPELSGEEFHACQHYIDACRSFGHGCRRAFLRARRRLFGPSCPELKNLSLKSPSLRNMMPYPASATAAAIRPTGP
mgnify:CR=1 FL=1